MLERAILTFGIIIGVFAIAVIVQSRARRQTQAAIGVVVPPDQRPEIPPGQAGILYFYGPHCGACRQQAAILQQLHADVALPVLKLDATVNTALADHLGVATVPATVVLAADGAVRAVNLGFRSRDALRLQLALAA